MWTVVFIAGEMIVQPQELRIERTCSKAFSIPCVVVQLRARIKKLRGRRKHRNLCVFSRRFTLRPVSECHFANLLSAVL